MTLGLLFALVSSNAAWGFCGTYVGGAGTSIYNSASQVAIVRQGTTTTITMANNVVGDAAEFAMVVPVPQVLTAADVTTVDAGLFSVLDGYSAPRLVEYTCDDFRYDGGGAVEDADAGGYGGGADSATGVTVESSFAVGSYDIVVLSATESGGLLEWLAANGYTGLDESAAALLGEYIDAGTYFFAAKVSLDAVPETASYLDPIQMSYTSAAFSLPIRLGTLNAPEDGTQDLYLYVLTEAESGSVGIANYDRLVIEDECMWRADEWADFGTYWATQIENARAELGAAGWVQEYAWATSWCDPCSSDPPNTGQVNQLGFVGTANDAYITRLHMQFSPSEAEQDLTLYVSGLPESEQIRYIMYSPDLEDQFPICGEETPADPGTCDDGSEEATEPDSDSDTGRDGVSDTGIDSDDETGPEGGSGIGAADGGAEEPRKGCTTAGLHSLPAGLAWVVALFALIGRWRRQ